MKKKLLALSVLMMFCKVASAELIYIDEESMMEMPAFTSQAAINRINPEPESVEDASIQSQVPAEVKPEQKTVPIVEVGKILREKSASVKKGKSFNKKKDNAFTMAALERACGNDFALNSIVFTKTPKLAASHIICEKK